MCHSSLPGRDPSNWLYFSEFADLAPGKIGARTGLIWDVCQSGRPYFRQAVAPHLGSKVLQVGIIGSVAYPDSVVIVPTFLRELLAPDVPLINTETVTSAAEAAKAATARRLFIQKLGS